MRSSSSTTTTFTTPTSTTPTSPNATTRGGSPRADDADSRSSSQSDAEGGQKPSLTTKVVTTPSLPELAPLQPDAHLMNITAELVDILLKAPNSEANQLGKSLANILKSCQRDGIKANGLQEIQDICLMMSGLVWGREGIGLGEAAHQKFEKLVDKVFNASNRPESTQGDDSSASRSEKADAESPSKKRIKRKVRSGEAPGSEGAEKKKSRKSGIEISTPKLTSPYSSKPHSTTGNSSTSTTTTTTTTTASTGVGASSSRSASTDSPPVSPRHLFSIAALVSADKPTGDSASLLGRIATNLSTFATQFETLVKFGHAIDRSNWGAIQQAQEIVKSLLETAGQPTSQLVRDNELSKLYRAIASLNKALQAAEATAEDVKHREFERVEFQMHAKRMTKVLESIQLKLSELQSSTAQPMSPRSAFGAIPADAASRVRSSSGGAKPSLSTFGRKAGKSIFQNANAMSPMSPQGDAPNSPRAARRSVVISVPGPNVKLNIEGTSTTATTANTVVSPVLRPAIAPLSPPMSPRALLKPQPQPLRLRPASQANAGGSDQSIAKLKAALGNYSMRNLLQGHAVIGNNVVPTGLASSTANTASSSVTAMPTPFAGGNAVGTTTDLRALLSGPSARNLLQRFRIDGGNVIASEGAQSPANVSLPTQASGDLSDADIAELVQKVEMGDTDLIGRMINSLEEVDEDVNDDVSENSVEDTVILSSSTDDSEISANGTTGA